MEASYVEASHSRSLVPAAGVAEGKRFAASFEGTFPRYILI